MCKLTQHALRGLSLTYLMVIYCMAGLWLIEKSWDSPELLSKIAENEFKANVYTTAMSLSETAGMVVIILAILGFVLGAILKIYDK